MRISRMDRQFYWTGTIWSKISSMMTDVNLKNVLNRSKKSRQDTSETKIAIIKIWTFLEIRMLWTFLVWKISPFGRK